MSLTHTQENVDQNQSTAEEILESLLELAKKSTERITQIPSIENPVDQKLQNQSVINPSNEESETDNLPSPSSTQPLHSNSVLAKLTCGQRLEDQEDDEDDEVQNSSSHIWKINPKKGESIDVIFPYNGDILVKTHYFEDPEIPGGFICPGGECPLCKLEYEQNTYLLRPAYDVGKKEIGVLAIPVSSEGKFKKTTDRYCHLSDELRKALKNRNLQKSIVTIKHKKNGYNVTAKDLHGNFKIDPEIISNFEKHLEEDENYLSSCFFSISVEDLREVESIRRRLEVNGL